LGQAIDPVWIRKTAISAFLLALPAAALLTRVHLNRRRRRFIKPEPLAFWVGTLVLMSFCSWVLNIAFWWSVLFAVGWPLFAAFVSLLGILLAFAAPVDRVKLVIANALLLVLSFSSLVSPN
jgi:hypothetical protein